MNLKKLSAHQLTKKIVLISLIYFFTFFSSRIIVPQGWVEVILFFCPLQPLSKGITFHGSKVSCFVMSAIFRQFHTALD